MLREEAEGVRRGRGEAELAYPSAKKVPYRSLTYYVGRSLRVFLRENPLLRHPAVYEGTLSGVFEDPAAFLLEDVSLLVLDYVPMQKYYTVVRREEVGALYIRMEEVRYFEVMKEEELQHLESEAPTEKNLL